jgi:hypothetical protein
VAFGQDLISAADDVLNDLALRVSKVLIVGPRPVAEEDPHVELARGDTVVEAHQI